MHIIVYGERFTIMYKCVLVHTLYYIGMYKEAESVWREAMNLMPDNAHFYSSLGVLLGRTRRLEVTNSSFNSTTALKLYIL